MKTLTETGLTSAGNQIEVIKETNSKIYKRINEIKEKIEELDRKSALFLFEKKKAGMKHREIVKGEEYTKLQNERDELHYEKKRLEYDVLSICDNCKNTTRYGDKGSFQVRGGFWVNYWDCQGFCRGEGCKKLAKERIREREIASRPARQEELNKIGEILDKPTA